jgi:diacylglycerol kinase
MEKQLFIIKRLNSFRYALEGVWAFLQTEVHARIHLLATTLVATAMFMLHTSVAEKITLLFCVVLVWVSEMFNTCIEKMLDIFSPGHHPKVKYIKDLAAAAVLFASIFSVAVALFIFIPKIF